MFCVEYLLSLESIQKKLITSIPNIGWTERIMGILFWPIFLGIITLIIILAKMHGDIEIIKEKVKTLFDLWNKSNGK